MSISLKNCIKKEDEINELGQNINTMSDKLETTIKQLRENNIELEKDIEKKSKIDEMRKQFISDVSHELKTPLTVIMTNAELLQSSEYDETERKAFFILEDKPVPDIGCE